MDLRTDIEWIREALLSERDSETIEKIKALLTKGNLNEPSEE